MRPELKLAKQLEKLSGLLGKDFEVVSPNESVDDKMREAQSILNYYEALGNGFYHTECRTCGGTFAYAWRVKGIRNCSVTCMVHDLEKIGIKWNPNKPPEERFQGTVPAIVPPQALVALLDSLHLAGSLKDDVQNTST